MSVGSIQTNTYTWPVARIIADQLYYDRYKAGQIMDATQIRTIRLVFCWIEAMYRFCSMKDCRNTARTEDFHFSCHVIERLGSWL